MIQVEHRGAHGALVDRGDRHHVACGRQRGVRQPPGPAHRGAVDELVNVVQGHRASVGQRRHHRRRACRFDTQHRGVRRPLGKVGRDAGDAPAASDGDHHQIRLRVELVEEFDGDRALAGHGARVVERWDQRRAGARHVSERGLGRQIVGRSADDQLDELPAVVADAVTLLLRRLGRDVDATANTKRSACEGEALRMVARRRAHHAGGQLLRRQLHEQVVGTAQLVGADGLQVFAFEVDAGPGCRGQPVGQL